MTTSFDERYSISKHNRSHQRPLFSCGIKLLDEYIHKQVGQDDRRQVAVTYVLNDEILKKIIGYYTLSSTTIEIIDLPDTLSGKLPHYPFLPATLIARLAVDVDYQKQGWGETLLVNALKRAHRASQEVASFSVVVEAINQDAVTFYEKHGFSILMGKKKLYLPMSVIVKF